MKVWFGGALMSRSAHKVVAFVATLAVAISALLLTGVVGLRRGGGDSDNMHMPPRAPRVLYREEPRYSEEAMRARINSSVRVSGTVSTAGIIEGIRVIRSAGFGLDEEALTACQHWRFAPGEKNGRPIAVPLALTLAFRIPEEGVPTASLRFDLPSGASRPVLEAGSLAGLVLRGTVIAVDFDVDQQGRVGSIKGQAGAIIDRISQWRFAPAFLKKVPIRVGATLTLVGSD
jgi:TonB family protein